MKVKEFKIENTGGNIYVAWGSFEDGTFFSIGEEAMFIYDEDEYVAMSNDDYDGYEWEQKHLIKEYGNYDGINKEYLDVLNQIWNQCTYSYKNELDLFNSIDTIMKREEKENYILNYGINNGISNYDNNYTNYKDVIDDILSIIGEIDCKDTYDVDYWYNYLKSIEE